jgi:hypothetical protein
VSPPPDEDARAGDHVGRLHRDLVAARLQRHAAASAGDEGLPPERDVAPADRGAQLPRFRASERADAREDVPLPRSQAADDAERAGTAAGAEGDEARRLPRRLTAREIAR